MKNKSILIIGIIFLLAAGFFVVNRLRRSDLTEEIELRLADNNRENPISIGNSQLENSDAVISFYEDRDYEEVWSNNGKINDLAEEFLEEIEAVKYDGLNPQDYNLAQINEFFEEIQNKRRILKPKSTPELVDLDLLMTDAFFKLSHDLEVGKISSQSQDSYWKLEAKEAKANYNELLQEIADGEDIQDGLASLYPKMDMYTKGREVLKDLYEKHEEDTLTWQQVSFDQSLKVGDVHQSIPGLRERLQFWGFLDEYETEDEQLFDSTMWEGLKRYQMENGMNPDGAIGDLTTEFLNNSTEKLIEIASVNMERMRWMPEIEWDKELVLVNIANYQLDYLTEGDTALTAKVIVGKEYNESPVFTAPMSYIVFSPYWNIPPSITNGEIIPSVQKNGNYLSEKNMEVVSNSGEVVNPKSVSWSGKDADNFPYRIRQKPGGSNSLGLVKFMFPNDYNIYIHDTPARSLFARETRALSHGCIRIQNPDKFAKILLKDDQWTDEKIHAAMNQDNEEVVQLDRKVPVLLLYLTFWADENGEGHFRPDIYNRDAALIKELKAGRKTKSVQKT